MSSLAAENRDARAQSVTVTDDSLAVDLIDGRTIIVPLVRSHFEIIGEGGYTHWPEVDEDLTVEGLLAGRRSGESAESLKRRLESRKRK